MTITLAPLPYALDALEPHMSRAALEAHHGHHHATYVKQVHELIRGTALDAAPLDEIVRVGARRTRKALYHAAAQAWNHAFFWQCMRPDGGGEPGGHLASMVARDFGSYAAMREQFATAAEHQFGSGWTWLVLHDDHLRIISTSNAGTPLVTRQVPLLTIDVWEHAYYLDYQYRRAAYIAGFIGHLVNWDFASRNLEAALAAHTQASRNPDPIASVAHG